MFSARGDRATWVAGPKPAGRPILLAIQARMQLVVLANRNRNRNRNRGAAIAHAAAAVRIYAVRASS